MKKNPVKFHTVAIIDDLPGKILTLLAHAVDKDAQKAYNTTNVKRYDADSFDYKSLFKDFAIVVHYPILDWQTTFYVTRLVCIYNDTYAKKPDYKRYLDMIAEVSGDDINHIIELDNDIREKRISWYHYKFATNRCFCFVTCIDEGGY